MRFSTTATDIIVTRRECSMLEPDEMTHERTQVLWASEMGKDRIFFWKTCEHIRKKDD